MLRIAAAGVAALLVAASPLAHAQTTGVAAPDRLSASDVDQLTDARLKIVKATLQLTPDQQKLWPAVENAVRTNAKDRQARLASAADRVDRLSDRPIEESLRDRDPIAFLNRRADALAQRSANLKNLAAAWAPLYKTLSDDQKQRMGVLEMFVLRDLRNRVDDRVLQALDDDE